jgi:hypothetical protein
MNREKKQLVIVGLLAVMVLSVGAFQFMGGSPTPPPAADKSSASDKAAEDAKKAEAEAVKNPDFADSLAKRDPFQKASFAIVVKEQEKLPVEEPKPSLPKPPRKDNSQKTSFGGDPDWSRRTLPSGDDKVGPLVVPEPQFGYSLIGIIAGEHPGAVFADSAGNQKLVEAGQGIDGDAVLLSVSRDKVRVKFHAKTLVLTVGGNPSAK